MTCSCVLSMQWSTEWSAPPQMAGLHLSSVTGLDQQRWQRQSTRKPQSPTRSDRIQSPIRIRMSTCPVWTPERDPDQSGGLRWSTAGTSWCPRRTATRSGGEARLFIMLIVMTLTPLINRTARPTVSVRWAPDGWALTPLSHVCLSAWHWRTGKTNLTLIYLTAMPASL